MGKIIFRETIISLLVAIAVLLILSVILYNYMPSNKVIPETVEYTPTKEIQQQLNSQVDEEQETTEPYVVTANDLDNYEKTNEYNPGKANPFAAASEPSTGDTTENSNTGNTTTDPIEGNNNNQGGTIYENGSSK